MAGGLENLTTLKLRLYLDEDWDSLFWHLHKCRNLESLHIKSTYSPPNAEMLEWLVWGPASLSALQTLTLHLRWYGTKAWLFGNVAVPPTCAVHIHVRIPVEQLVVRAYNDDTSEWQQVNQEAVVPPIRHGLAKQIRSLRVIFDCLSAKESAISVSLENLLLCQQLSHVTFEVWTLHDIPLTFSIHHVNQASKVLQTIDINFKRGEVPRRFKLIHFGWKRKRQPANVPEADKNKHIQLVRH